MLRPAFAEILAGHSAIAHGFFTRHGGVSRGGYASLNCGLGSKDDPEAVRENRARVAAFLGAQSVITANQVHSATAVVAGAPWSSAGRPRADAIITVKPGLAVAVLTADCAPVLLADAQAKVVAAAHAGWRGALSGVLEATLSGMEGLGARRECIIAAIGPAIAQPAYEVGLDFEQEFLRRDGESAHFFTRESGGAKPHFDLAGYAESRLTRAGVGNVRRLISCTHAHEADFFSYRRSIARKEPDYGRQISAIVLT